MNPSQPRHIQSGGRRMELYAELGRYFTPDGNLKGTVFRRFIQESLQSHLADRSDCPDALESAGKWLSSHLDEILGYLEERGLNEAGLALFETALDESAALGIPMVSLSPDRLRVALAARHKVEERADKNTQRDPNAKRTRIFDAAVQVFSERGFHTATMDDIAQASGVAKGTLYRYFHSKEDLLEQLLRRTSRALMVRFSEAFTGEGDILTQIEAFITSWFAFIEENHVLYRLIQIEGLSAPAGRQTTIYEYLLDDFPMVKEHFAALNTARALKTPNFHTVAYGVLGFIDGVTRKWFRSGRSYPLRDELPVVLEVLFHGFVRDASRSRPYYISPEQEAHNNAGE